MVQPLRRWSAAGFDGALAYSSPSSGGLCAVDEDTVFDIGSVTKTVTATAVLSLGADVSYSNSGYTLLAAIVERASGRPFRDELTAEVLTLPDGSVAGGFWSDGLPSGAPWALEGAGGVAMSARQLHDWTVALTSGEIIGEESLELMTEPRVETDDGSLTYGWGSLDPETLGAPALVSVGGGSSGHEVALFWLPEGEQVVVLASSSEGVRAEDLAPAVVPALVAGDEVPPPVASVTGDPADLVALDGRPT